MRILAVLLLSALTITPVHAQSTGLFKDYDALATPRANLPIGAQWIPTVGPGGAGDPTNVSITQGVSSNTLSTNVKKQIAFVLGNLLGIGGGSTTVTSVELSDIEIHRVADLSLLKISAGQQVLFEGVKAGKITMTVDKESALKLNANAAARGVPITASADMGNMRKVTLDGSNLFLAYQVISLGVPKVTIKSHRYKESLVTIDKFHRFTFYMSGDGDNSRVTQVRYQNIASPLPDGSFPTEVISVKEQPSGDGFYGIWDFSLPRYAAGNSLTATGVTINHKRGRVCFDPAKVTFPDGSGRCISGPTEGKIEIRSSTFKIARVKNPSATY